MIDSDYMVHAISMELSQTFRPSTIYRTNINYAENKNRKFSRTIMTTSKQRKSRFFFLFFFLCPNFVMFESSENLTLTLFWKQAYHSGQWFTEYFNNENAAIYSENSDRSYQLPCENIMARHRQCHSSIETINLQSWCGMSNIQYN